MTAVERNDPGQRCTPTAARPHPRRLIAALLIALLGPGASAGDPAHPHATVPYPLAGCATATDTDCIAHVFPSYAEAVTLRGTRPPPCYLELWDEALWNAVAGYPEHHACRRGPPPDAAIQRYFRCLDPACTGSGRPQLGVSLEGGGSKSAPFSLGVLAGLEDAGLLHQVEVISSVSGGSYAAYFYISRLHDRLAGARGQPASTPADWFRSCIPPGYRAYFSPALAENLPFCSSTYGIGEGGAYRYQRHLGFWQDLMAATGSLRGSGDRLEHLNSIGTIGALAAGHAATVWPLGIDGLGVLGSAHHLTHSLFDWPENFSPSREAYRQGIERAYGYDPQAWAADQALPQGEAFNQRRATRTMSDLRASYQRARAECPPGDPHCRRMPLWVANTTASTGRHLDNWLRSPERDALRHQFELTPIGHGSGHFGYANVPPPMAMMDAVGASAAFLDDEQRLIGEAPLRLFASLVLHLFNLDWGTELANFNLPDAQRSTHRWVPWPFYTQSSGRHGAPYIHLSDGGNSDNIGMLAQLRRGVRHIVVSASTMDREGRFPSLCRLKNQLELDGTYRLEAPELMDFDKVCNLELGRADERTWGETAVARLACRRHGLEPGPECDAVLPGDHYLRKVHGYDLFRWDRPFVRACIVRLPAGAEVTTALGHCNFAEGHDPDPAASRLIASLYVLKPAIDVEAAADQLDLDRHAHRLEGEAADYTRRRALCGCFADLLPQAHAEGSARPVEAGAITDCAPSGVPGQGGTLGCTPLAFLRVNTCHADGYPHFPQHDFIFMTLNSSHSLFSAYYELGRQYAAELRFEPARAGTPGAVVAADKARARSVLAPLPADPCLTAGWDSPACAARVRHDTYRKFLCVRPSAQDCANGADNATLPGNCGRALKYLPEQDDRRLRPPP